MSNVIKFSQIKESISDKGLKNISFVIDDLMTKYLQSKASINHVVEERIKRVFSGTGVFEQVSDERKNDSIERLNSKITAALFSKSIEDARLSYEVKFDDDPVTGTFAPDAQTKNLMKSPQIWKNKTFVNAFMSNYEIAISPAAQVVSVGFYDDLAQIHTCGWGEDIRFTVESNEAFVVQPIGQDTFKMAKQSLKSKDYVATPKAHGARVSINFYDMASGKLNWADHIMKISRAFADRWNQCAIEALYSYISDATTKFTVNTPFFKTTFSDANWNAIVKAIPAANGMGAIKAYGDLDALTQILPSTTVATMDAALASVLGKEWTANGYIGEYHGASLSVLPQKFLPGTINSNGADAVFGAPEDLIIFTNEGVKPLHLSIEGGTLYVNRDYMETGDTTLDFAIAANYDLLYIPGDKIGAMHL